KYMSVSVLLSSINVMVEHAERCNKHRFRDIWQGLLVQIEAAKKGVHSFANRATCAPPESNHLEIAFAILLVSFAEVSDATSINPFLLLLDHVIQIFIRLKANRWIDDICTV